MPCAGAGPRPPPPGQRASGSPRPIPARVRRRPGSSSTAGVQSSSSWASEMSGRRTAGSSCGSASNTTCDAAAGDADDHLGQLQDRELGRVAEVHRLVVVAVDQAQEALDQVGHEAERARLAPVAEDRERLVLERLADEGRDRAPVVRAHARAVGVEDPRDVGVDALLAVVGHRQRLGVALGLVVDPARADRVDVAPVALALGVLLAGRRRPRWSRPAGSGPGGAWPGRGRCGCRRSPPSGCAAAGAGSRSGWPARPGGRRSRSARRSRGARSCRAGRTRSAGSRMCSMFSSVPVSRLSTQMTRWPSARSRSQRCEPRKPAPPVTREVGTAVSLVPASATRRAAPPSEERPAGRRRPRRARAGARARAAATKTASARSAFAASSGSDLQRGEVVRGQRQVEQDGGQPRRCAAAASRPRLAAGELAEGQRREVLPHARQEHRGVQEHADGGRQREAGLLHRPEQDRGRARSSARP